MQSCSKKGVLYFRTLRIPCKRSIALGCEDMIDIAFAPRLTGAATAPVDGVMTRREPCVVRV